MSDQLSNQVASHYGGRGELADAIAASLQRVGKSLDTITTADLASVDEFHIRGRSATLDLARRMNLQAENRVLDIGSGLGGPARTMAETYGCHVTGIDLTPAFCDAANTLSAWVGLSDRTHFRQGDATALPFEDDHFDAAMTIHVAMNIAAKDRMYAEAHRVLRPGGIFAVYDVVQGEGGAIHFPVPWARVPSISHLASPAEMEKLLTEAGFRLIEVRDSTEESLGWFEELARKLAEAGPPALTFQTFLGADFPEMARNQVRNLRERRARTVTFIGVA